MKSKIPQAITLSSILLGMLSMVWALEQPYWACNALVGAALCDLLDGRIARMLGVQSQFGAQLDSLADIVAFGLAPAFLAYQTSLAGAAYLGSLDLGLIPAFAYVACAAIRLARFNAQQIQGEERGYFEGIPAPVAGLTLVASLMAAQEVGADWLSTAAMSSGLLVATAVLMVTRIPVPSFKQWSSRWAPTLFFGLVAGGLLLLLIGGPGGTVLLSLLTFYIVRGVLLALLRGSPTPALG